MTANKKFSIVLLIGLMVLIISVVLVQNFSVRGTEYSVDQVLILSDQVHENPPDHEAFAELLKIIETGFEDVSIQAIFAVSNAPVSMIDQNRDRIAAALVEKRACFENEYQFLKACAMLVSRIPHGDTQYLPLVEDAMGLGLANGNCDLAWVACEAAGALGPNAESLWPIMLVAFQIPRDADRAVGHPQARVYAVSAYAKMELKFHILEAPLRAHLNDDNLLFSSSVAALILRYEPDDVDAKRVLDSVEIAAKEYEHLNLEIARTIGEINPSIQWDTSLE